MNEEEYQYIITFTSHNKALYIFQRLRKKAKVKLVNSPIKINLSCTQAIKFQEKDLKCVEHEIDINNIYPVSIFKIIKVGNNEKYELLE